MDARAGGCPYLFRQGAGRLIGDVFGLDIARRLEAGIVHVNDQPVTDEPSMPFDGVKESGWGRFGTGFAAEEFTELRWITLRGKPRDFPF
ncbi:aldehyde dehydrogenase family protein [Streptomyces viridochromogenes]|uniref:aldehyde dehydrogenase family protein n=1 Tax=Streptomyces viridochromogenes TaxID=1938 RepID=UPI000D149CBC|nr:aldehyde dehydrogenase family protein [Streptomyces viridochromogenes]